MRRDFRRCLFNFEVVGVFAVSAGFHIVSAMCLEFRFGTMVDDNMKGRSFGFDKGNAARNSAQHLLASFPSEMSAPGQSIFRSFP